MNVVNLVICAGKILYLSDSPALPGVVCVRCGVTLANEVRIGRQWSVIASN